MRVLVQVGWMLVVITMLAGGCGAQGSPASSRPSASGDSASAPIQPKVIVVGIMQEPTSWAPFVVNTSAGGTLQPPVLITRTLTVVNNQGAPQAELAVAIPTLDSADWKVNPDGSMDQTWKLRPEARWHDGQPITAEDYVLGWQIYTNPQIPVADQSAKQISNATAVDPTTLQLHFQGTTPLAAQALFNPYPRHLIGDLYSQGGDFSRFMNDQYWTTSYVGAGPYRLDTWTPGASIQYQAFAQYVFGKPKVDTIIIRFLGDQNTLVANVLGGNVDVALPDGISVEQALDLQRGWAAPGTGNNVVLYSDGRLYWLEFQEREEYARPSAARDPRVRAALYHAIDKDGVIEVEVAGLGPQADSWILPDDPRRPDYRSAIPEWSYDPSLAQRMLQQAGYQRGADGVMVNSANGERLDPELRVTQTAGHVKALSVMGAGWRQAGADVSETVIPVNRNNDGEYRSTFPFVGLSGNYVALVWETTHYDCRSASSPANRWSSANNRSGYCNPAIQPLIERLQVTVADRDRAALRAQIMEQVLVKEYSYLPLYWQVQPIVFGKAVSGLGKLQSGPFGSPLTGWNAHLWDKQ